MFIAFIVIQVTSYQQQRLKSSLFSVRLSLWNEYRILGIFYCDSQ